MFVDTLHDVLWLAKQAFGFAILLWPVTLGLVAFLIGALIWQKRARKTNLQDSGHIRLTLWIPSLFSLAILFWGSLMTWSNSAPTAAPSWRLTTIFILIAIQLLVSAHVVWKAKGFRVFALSVVGLQGWVTFLFAQMAGMAVTANWA